MKQTMITDPDPDPDAEVVDLTAELIRIDSSNPDLGADGAGESAIADHVGAWLSARGFAVRRLEATPDRPSVVAVAQGRDGGRSLMLNGHLDTVSLTSYAGDPLDPVIVDDQLHGRGAYDMLSGVAALMVAAARAHRTSHRGEIVVALVADEEAGSLGTAEVLREVRTDAAVVCEPTGLDVVVAHLGFVWAEVTIHGRAAHGSRPDLGVDAIARAGRFLAGIERLAAELAGRSPHPLLGCGNVHAGVITGGQETSSYAERCTVSVERRTVPGEDAGTLRAELEQLLHQAYGEEAAWDLTIGLQREPFALRADAPILTATERALTRQLGRLPVRRGERFWTDCALLADAGIDALLVGVHGGGAHADTEWVDLPSLRTLTQVLEDVIIDFTA